MIGLRTQSRASRMKPALVLVDLQGDHLATLQNPASSGVLIQNVAALLDGCRTRHVPAIHIWTTLRRGRDRRLPHLEQADRWICLEGTNGHKPPAPLQPAVRETIVHKTGFNGFVDGALDDALSEIGCDTVIIAGLHLHVCVRAVAVESLERNLRVWIADDAVASNDPVLSAGTRRWLASRCVEFLPTAEILSRLDGRAPSPLIHRSPRETRKVLFEIPVANLAEIAAATSSARQSFKRWRKKPVRSRLDILMRVVANLGTSAPKLARQMAVEIGKPISQGLEEVRRAAANIRDVARRADASSFVQRESAGEIRHKPVGVIGLISPWNNPVAIPLGKIAPALAYGNAVVWKPAPAATPISEFLLELLHAAGVPNGAVRLVTGDHTTAQLLVADENVDAVTITGSASAGYAIQEICARRFLPLQAELNGNNAAIVWDDADLPKAAAQIAWGAFGFAGQRCTANRRVIIPKEIFVKFWRALKIAANHLNWGDPLKASTDIGPVIHWGKCQEHSALIESARRSSAVERLEYLFGGKKDEPWMKRGAYARPAMAHCEDPAHPLVQEETMSPLLVVQCAKNFEHALSLCNGVRQGLAAALFSKSASLQKQFLAEAQAGILKVNSTTAGVDVSLPFGGWKMSGLGPPEHGVGDPLFYTRMQAVYGAQKS